MKPITLVNRILLGSCVLVATYTPAAMAEVFVIANGADITSTDLHDIYTGEKQFAGSVKLIPVDNSASQAEFLKKVVTLDAAKYNSAWIKKSFRDGANAPPVKSSDAEVVSFVKSTPGAIGYVSSEPKDAKVIAKF